MSKNELQNKRLVSLAWGAAFILIGALSLIPGDQTSLAVLGCGLILLALNAGRSLSSLPISGLSLALGAAAVLAGLFGIARSQLGMRFEVQLLPLVLIAIGVYCLWPRRQTDDSGRP